MKKSLWCALALWISIKSVSSTSAAMVPKRTVLDNGIVLLTSEQRALPMVTIELLIDAGSRNEPANQAGLANLTSQLLTHGTQKRSATRISETLDFMGASLSTGAGEDVATVSMTILKKDLATGLELLADILTHSNFPQPEIDRQKLAVIASIRAREEDPGSVAEKAFAAALFPKSTYGRPVEGSPSSVKGLQQKALQEFFTRNYRPNRTIIAVVGDVAEQEIAQALSRAMKNWTKGTPAAKPTAPAEIGKAQNVEVNKDLTQANIVLGHNGVARGNPDYYAVQVMNYILGGGGFSSRAMDSIRNERGLAYSVYSYFSAEKSHGSFQFVMQTKNETAFEAIRIAKEEMRRMRERPVTDQELNDAKDYLIGSFPLRFDTNRKVAGFLAQVEYYELGLDYPDRYASLVRKVTGDDVLRVAKQYLHPEELITVIVANQKKTGQKK
jgi:zinc protease